MQKKSGVRGGSALGNALSVSQNYLTSAETVRRLLRCADLNRRDHVLEIGAGKGHITKALSAACKRVTAYELDNRLCDRLYQKQKTEALANVHLIRGDFLQARLPDTPYKVFSNIPFSRTSEIVRKLTQAKNPPSHIWLIMEKGAAKRFCGLPGENKASLLLKPFFTASIVYHLKRTDFHPAPGVDTVLLQLVRREAPDLMPGQRESYGRFLEGCQKNGLYGNKVLLTKKQVSTALRLAGLPQIGPSGSVSYIQWLCLFRCWLRFQNPGPGPQP